MKIFIYQETKIKLSQIIDYCCVETIKVNGRNIQHIFQSIKVII